MTPDPNDPRWSDPAGLRWLFVDLNSYFASVEQQLRPELRGRPVIVRPAPSESTCAIAASHEAKQLGIRAGSRVSEARALCRAQGLDLAVVEARPDIYVQMHKAIMRAVEGCLPIHKVCSIDEAACRLDGPDRFEANALDLARAVQGAILDVGDWLGSSVGLAPSRLLAKLACGMKKPRGLTVLRADRMPEPILDLPLSSVPGVGPRMERRLRAAGIVDMGDLWALGARDARRLWGSIEGERVWRGLRGEDVPDVQANPLASISHGHVLPGEARRPDQARAVARRLVVKCGARLRRLDLTGASLSLHVDLLDRERRSHFASLEQRLAPTSDTFVMLRLVDELWGRLAGEIDDRPVRYVGVGVGGLARYGQGGGGDLFGWSPEAEENPRSMALSRALDALNARFGKDAVSIGPRPKVSAFLGAKIAFNRIPEEAEFRE